jgi:hypothetical protein
MTTSSFRCLTYRRWYAMSRNMADNDQYSNDELAKYKKMIKDSKKPFYHGCVAQYMRLFAMVKTFPVEAKQQIE